MGFDVVYLPPVHPIGTTFRKGRNNTLTPAEGDPGSPWAIGSPEGGHDALHPDLGTMDDFDAFVARTRELGMEVALDLALQASPDHPWVSEHPEWFTQRADGSIAYAENPPKKYQDIYPMNFDNDPEGIYAEVLRIVRQWMDHGVRIFRVDNPHTKPLRFWERLLGEIRGTDPDVLFLAEAFTRPAMMHTLAKIGFHQSYTYFTWRNGAQELLHQHPRHPERVPPARRGARVQDPGGARRHAVPDLGYLLRVRTMRKRADQAGQRGVHGFGEIPVPAARLGGGGQGRHRDRRLHHRAQPDPADSPGPAQTAQSSLPRR
jgi:glycosidase